MDALDDLFNDSSAPAPVPKKNDYHMHLFYFCLTKDHVRCRGYGWMNTEEGKTISNAGERVKARCSCPCHEAQP